LLLNTAVPQIQAAQSGDTYVVPRDIAFSAALTLSAGTVNGVAFLNASKVLTTGSALTFDGTTLKNTAGNSGTSIAGNAVLALEDDVNAVISFNVPDANAAGLFFGYGGNPYWAGIEKDGSTGLRLVSGGIMTFSVSGSEQMRLTSTGLGIGTSSPDSGFQLTAYADVAGAIRVRGGGTGSNTARTASLSLLSSGNEEWIVRGANDSLRFLQSSTERARITSGGDFQTSSGGSVQVGGTAARATTAGTNRLDIFDGTAPVGTLANGVSFYSTAGEARVMDAAGNATLLSPHDTATNEWIFHSKHTPTGKVLKIDVERLLKFVNDHFGLDAVHEFIED
jgi:hypothetical protein